MANSEPIIVFPGAFKPPLPYHFWCVREATDRFPESQLAVLVTNRTRGNWTVSDALRIWKEFFPNLTVLGCDNPVGDAIERAWSDQRVVILCTQHDLLDTFRKEIDESQILEMQVPALDLIGLTPILARRIADPQRISIMIQMMNAEPHKKLCEFVTPDEYLEYIDALCHLQ